MTFTAAINPMVPLNLLFPLQRVICPQSRQSANYQFDNSLLINLLTTILPNGNNLAYHIPLLPLNQQHPTKKGNVSVLPKHKPKEHCANTTYSIPLNKSLIQYLQKYLFRPLKEFSLNHHRNNQLPTWAVFTDNAVTKNLHTSQANEKGQIKLPRQGIVSTRPTETDDDISQKVED